MVLEIQSEHDGRKLKDLQTTLFFKGGIDAENEPREEAALTKVKCGL